MENFYNLYFIKYLKNKHKQIIKLLLVFIFTCSQAVAFNPKSACNFLNEINGLSTQGYKYGGYGDYFCASPYKMLEKNSRSNLAYYVDGTKNNATRIYLVLNVYNNSNKPLMHNYLLNASKSLSTNSINYKLPLSIINSIKNGKAGIWKHGNYTITLKRDNWSTGLGYELHFIIEE